MGRLPFLQRTLNTWLQNTSLPIRIVDYMCPQEAGRWVEEAGFGPRVSLIRCDAEIRNGKAVFNPSRARNAGAAGIRDGFLVFIDSDVELLPGFGERISADLGPKRMLIVSPPPGTGYDLAGVLVVHAAAFQSIGGFDDELEGYGCEMSDIKIRLYLQGVRPSVIPMNLTCAIPHTDAMRAEHFAEKNIRLTKAGNQRRLDIKLRRMFRKSYRQLLSEPGIRRMMSS